jgi:hypothetical protein
LSLRPTVLAPHYDSLRDTILLIMDRRLRACANRQLIHSIYHVSSDLYSSLFFSISFITFRYPNWGDDLGSEHERYLCEKVRSEASMPPFYTFLCPPLSPYCYIYTSLPHSPLIITIAPYSHCHSHALPSSPSLSHSPLTLTHQPSHTSLSDIRSPHHSDKLPQRDQSLLHEAQ